MLLCDIFQIYHYNSLFFFQLHISSIQSFAKCYGQDSKFTELLTPFKVGRIEKVGADEMLKYWGS